MMKRIWYWIIGIVLLALVAVFVLSAMGIFNFNGFGFYRMNQRTFPRSYDQWDHYGMGPGMHFFPMMGFFGPFLMLLVPLGFIALVVGGIYLLVNAGKKNTPTNVKPEVRLCGNCGKPVDSDWQVCPYCGEPLQKD